MNKEIIDKISDDHEKNFNENENTKRLCVHDLKRKLKDKQKKEISIPDIIKKDIETLIKK